MAVRATGHVARAIIASPPHRRAAARPRLQAVERAALEPRPRVVRARPRAQRGQPLRHRDLDAGRSYPSTSTRSISRSWRSPARARRGRCRRGPTSSSATGRRCAPRRGRSSATRRGTSWPIRSTPSCTGSRSATAAAGRCSTTFTAAAGCRPGSARSSRSATSTGSGRPGRRARSTRKTKRCPTGRRRRGRGAARPRALRAAGAAGARRGHPAARPARPAPAVVLLPAAPHARADRPPDGRARGHGLPQARPDPARYLRAERREASSRGARARRRRGPGVPRVRARGRGPGPRASGSAGGREDPARAARNRAGGSF